MLACARIGAVHSVVFGGFGADALAGRLADSRSGARLTADGAAPRCKCGEGRGLGQGRLGGATTRGHADGRVAGAKQWGKCHVEDRAYSLPPTQVRAKRA